MRFLVCVLYAFCVFLLPSPPTTSPLGFFFFFLFLLSGGIPDVARVSHSAGRRFPTHTYYLLHNRRVVTPAVVTSVRAIFVTSKRSHTHTHGHDHPGAACVIPSLFTSLLLSCSECFTSSVPSGVFGHRAVVWSCVCVCVFERRAMIVSPTDELQRTNSSADDWNRGRTMSYWQQPSCPGKKIFFWKKSQSLLTFFYARVSDIGERLIFLSFSACNRVLYRFVITSASS